MVPTRTGRVETDPDQTLAEAKACGEGAGLTGTVLDASGGPIAGAVLRADDGSGHGACVALSRADGSYRLNVPPGLVRISATADGYSQQIRDLLAPLDGVQLVLTPESSIVGRVLVESTREPVAGIWVTATGPDGAEPVSRVERTRSDGSFRIERASSGRYALVASAERWRSAERIVQLAPGGDSDPIELQVRRAAQVKGVVRVEDTACSRGWVRAAGPTPAYQPLDAQGNVAFDGLLPGRYEFDVHCEGALPLVEAIDIGVESLTRAWNSSRGLQVTGVARSFDGHPLSGATIEVSPSGEPFERASTDCLSDDDGEFVCTGISAGQYECVIGPGWPPRSESMRVTVAEGATPRVELRARAEGTLRVRLENTSGLELSTLVVLASAGVRTSQGKWTDGEFVFDPLALGSYTVAVESSASGPAQQVRLSMPGEVARVTLALPAAGMISGRILDQTGAAVPDAWIRAAGSTLNASARPSAPVMSDGDGAFSIPGLLPGQYRLDVSSPLGDAQLEDVAANSRGVVVRVRPHRDVSGSAVIAEGATD